MFTFFSLPMGMAEGTWQVPNCESALLKSPCDISPTLLGKFLFPIDGALTSKRSPCTSTFVARYRRIGHDADGLDVGSVCGGGGSGSRGCLLHDELRRWVQRQRLRYRHRRSTGPIARCGIDSRRFSNRCGLSVLPTVSPEHASRARIDYPELRIAFRSKPYAGATVRSVKPTLACAVWRPGELGKVGVAASFLQALVLAGQFRYSSLVVVSGQRIPSRSSVSCFPDPGGRRYRVAHVFHSTIVEPS